MVHDLGFICSDPLPIGIGQDGCYKQQLQSGWLSVLVILRRELGERCRDRTSDLAEDVVVVRDGGQAPTTEARRGVGHTFLRMDPKDAIRDDSCSYA